MSRLIIWFVAIAGLLPVAFLSIESLRADAVVRRMHKQSPNPDSLSLAVRHSIEIGPSITTIRLSTETWPAVVALCGIVFVLVGMFFLLPGKPQRFYRNGLSRIGHYVQRVLESHKEYASVAIAKPDGGSAILFARRDHRALLSVISLVSMDKRSDLPTKIREFFANRGIMPLGKQLPNATGIKDLTAHLEFPLDVDPKANAELIRALLRDVFGVDDSTGLEFTATGL